MANKREKLDLLEAQVAKLKSLVRPKNIEDTIFESYESLIETELDQAETILAIKEIHDTLLKSIESYNRMNAEQIIPITDELKKNFDDITGSTFSSDVHKALDDVLAALKNAKDIVYNKISQLESGNPMANAPVNTDMPSDVDNMNPTDTTANMDQTVEPSPAEVPNPLGRDLKPGVTESETKDIPEFGKNLMSKAGNDSELQTKIREFLSSLDKCAIGSGRRDLTAATEEAVNYVLDGDKKKSAKKLKEIKKQKAKVTDKHFKPIFKMIKGIIDHVAKHDIDKLDESFVGTVKKAVNHKAKDIIESSNLVGFNSDEMKFGLTKIVETLSWSGVASETGVKDITASMQNAVSWAKKHDTKTVKYILSKLVETYKNNPSNLDPEAFPYIYETILDLSRQASNEADIEVTTPYSDSEPETEIVQHDDEVVEDSIGDFQKKNNSTLMKPPPRLLSKDATDDDKIYKIAYGVFMSSLVKPMSKVDLEKTVSDEANQYRVSDKTNIINKVNSLVNKFSNSVHEDDVTEDLTADIGTAITKMDPMARQRLRTSVAKAATTLRTNDVDSLTSDVTTLLRKQGVK